MIINTKNIKKRYANKNGYYDTNVNCIFENFNLPNKIVNGLGFLPEKNKLSTCLGDCDSTISLKIPFTGQTSNYVSSNGYSYFNDNNILYRIDKNGIFNKFSFDSEILGLVIDKERNDLYVIKDLDYIYFNNINPAISGSSGYLKYSTEVKYSEFSEELNSVLIITSGVSTNFIITLYSGSTNTNLISFNDTYLSSLLIKDELYILIPEGLLIYDLSDINNIRKKQTFFYSFENTKSKLLLINDVIYIFNGENVLTYKNNMFSKAFKIDDTYLDIQYNHLTECLYINYSSGVKVFTINGIQIASGDTNSVLILFDFINNYSLFNNPNEDKLIIATIDYIKNILGFQNGGIQFSGTSQSFTIQYSGNNEYSKINLILSPKVNEEFSTNQLLLSTTGDTITNSINLTKLPNNEYIFKSIYEFTSELNFYSGITFTNFVKNDPSYITYGNYDKNSDLYLGYITLPPFIEFIGSDSNQFGSGDVSQKIEEYTVDPITSINLRSIPNGDVLVYQNNNIITTDNYAVDTNGRINFYTPISGDVKFVYLGGNINRNNVIERLTLSGITTYSSTTPNDKIYLTGIPTSYVVRLDNNLIGSAELTLNGVSLILNEDYYPYSNNKILIKNQGITTPRTLQIQYQAETTVNVNLTNKLMNVSVSTIPFNTNGFVNFVIKDSQNNIIHIETQNWVANKTIYEFGYIFKKAGTYKYYCENIYKNFLINGNSIFTTRKTPEYFTTISSEIVNQINEFTVPQLTSVDDNLFVSPVIINIANKIGETTLDVEDFIVPEFVE